MCIGQDVRGNIKLSLKATKPRPGGLEVDNVVEGSGASAKETANIWAPVWNASKEQEQQNSASEFPIRKNEVGEAKPPTSQVPVFLIRSAEECDEDEKSTSLNLTSKGTPTDNGGQPNRKSKSRRSQDVIDSASSPSGPFPHTNVKKSKLSTQKKSNANFQKSEGDENEPEDKASVTAKGLKLGTKVTAKVYQIRAHGLVLDLGGGLRGMYRFEVGVAFFIS